LHHREVGWWFVPALRQPVDPQPKLEWLGGSRLLKRPDPRRNQGFRPLLLPNARRLQFDFQFPRLGHGSVGAVERSIGEGWAGACRDTDYQ